MRAETQLTSTTQTFAHAYSGTLLCTALIGGGIKWCFCLTSVCLSAAYIGPKSRTERPRKTKIGTEVAHVTCDSDTTFKVKRSKVKVIRPLCLALYWRIRQLQQWARERVGCGKLLLRCCLFGGGRRFGAHGGGEGRGIQWRPPACSLFRLRSTDKENCCTVKSNFIFFIYHCTEQYTFELKFCIFMQTDNKHLIS